MIEKIFGALVRALLVSFVIAAPSLFLSDISQDASHVTITLGLIFGGLVYLEYVYESPSLVEFRNAPPFNRIRFIWLAVTIVAFCSFFQTRLNGEDLGVLGSVATILGHAFDFPYSPVRLVTLIVPFGADPVVVEVILMSAGFGLLGFVTVSLLFYSYIRVTRWPTSQGTFNIWQNLPLFDPLADGQLADHLRRDGRVNICLGVLLLFIIPATIRMAAPYLGTDFLTEPQNLIWVLSAWSVLPTSLVMRGIAMLRVAEIVDAEYVLSSHQTV